MAPQNPELITAVTEMTKEARGLRNEVTDLKTYGRRNRHLIKIVGASLIFDLLLSIGLGYGLHQGSITDKKASQARDTIVTTQIAGCEFGNNSRSAEQKIWDAIFLVVKPPPNETQEEMKVRVGAINQIKELVNTAYGQRDCAKAVLK